MVIPFLGWDFKMASTSGRKGCYVLRDKTGLELKGGLYPTHMPDGSAVLLFLGSPRLATLEDLQVGVDAVDCFPKPDGELAASYAPPLCLPQAHDMFICDIPPHDMSADFVVMAERRQVQAEMATKLAVRRAQNYPSTLSCVCLATRLDNDTSRLFAYLLPG